MACMGDEASACQRTKIMIALYILMTLTGIAKAKGKFGWTMLTVVHLS